MYSRLDLLAGPQISPLFSDAPEPFGVVVGPDGGIYFGDVTNHRVFRIDPTSKVISVVVGRGESGNDGDGGDPLDAAITQPYEIRFDGDGNLFIVDMLAQVVRRVDSGGRHIETVAGCGKEGFSGDGGPAPSAQLARPHSIELDANGLLYIADIANHRIRVVDLESGQIETFAGTGESMATRVGESLSGNPLHGPRAIAFEADGAMVLGLREGNAIYRVDMKLHTISHIAGNGEFGYSGDGGAAVAAALAGPKGIALGREGDIILADTESHTVRRIDSRGIISTIAGTGESGDSLNPREPCLNRPHGVFVEASGAVLIGDSDNRRLVRLV
jgi:sugar lactone lactonase YvrE